MKTGSEDWTIIVRWDGPDAALMSFSRWLSKVFAIQCRLELKAEADAVRRDIARTMRSAKERAAATDAVQREVEERAKRQMDEEERAEAFEVKQREKALNASAKAATAPVLMVEDFADEVASYRARTRKNKEVSIYVEQPISSCLNRFALVSHSSLWFENKISIPKSGDRYDKSQLWLINGISKFSYS